MEHMRIKTPSSWHQSAPFPIFFCLCKDWGQPSSNTQSKRDRRSPWRALSLHVFAGWIPLFCGHRTDGQSHSSRLPKLMPVYRQATDKTILPLGRTKLMCKLKGEFEVSVKPYPWRWIFFLLKKDRHLKKSVLDKKHIAENGNRFFSMEQEQ